MQKALSTFWKQCKSRTVRASRQVKAEAARQMGGRGARTQEAAEGRGERLNKRARKRDRRELAGSRGEAGRYESVHCGEHHLVGALKHHRQVEAQARPSPGAPPLLRKHAPAQVDAHTSLIYQITAQGASGQGASLLNYRTVPPRHRHC